MENNIDNENETEEYKYNCDSCGFKCKFNSQWEKHIETELHKTGKKKNVLIVNLLLNVIDVIIRQKIQ